jgi:hypothetical protein
MDNVNDKPSQDGKVESRPATSTPAKAEPASKIEMLLELMLESKGKELAEAKQKEIGIQAKEKQRRINAEHQVDSLIETQRTCRHLKGGKRGPKNQNRDYALFVHTYINRETVVRCMICRMAWKKDDTDEFLFRHGKKIANHTGLGWRKVQDLLTQTTNTPSKSEMMLDVKPPDDKLVEV